MRAPLPPPPLLCPVPAGDARWSAIDPPRLDRGPGFRLTDDDLQREVLVLDDVAATGLDVVAACRRLGRSAVRTSACWLPGYHDVDPRPALRGDDPASWRWDDLPLLPLVRGSAACALRRAAIEPERDRTLLAQLAAETIRVYEAARRVFALEGGPCCAVVFNGRFHQPRAVLEAARRSGVRTIVTETSCFPGRVWFETRAGGTGARSALGRLDRAELDAALLAPDERERVVQMLRTHVRGRAARRDIGTPPASVDLASLRSALGVPEGHRVLLLFGQVCSDTTLVDDAPVLADVVRLAEIAAEVVERTPGWKLLVKPHPKEAVGTDPVFGRDYGNATYRRLRASGLDRRARVRVLEPCGQNPYDLMRLADVGLAINSQACFEMVAAEAKPVVLCGTGFFTGKGCTIDVAHEAAIAPTLAAVLAAPELAPEAHERALAVAHRLLVHELVDARGEDPRVDERQSAAIDGGPVRAVAPGPRTDPGHAADIGARRGYPVPEEVSAALRPEFRSLRGGFALQTLLDHLAFDTVLDVGSGKGKHAALLAAHGKRVTAVDLGRSTYFAQRGPDDAAVVGDVLDVELGGPFDLVWASHVLEHQPDVRRFLRRLRDATREDGLLAIVVPPLKHEIVGGHLTLWNAGLVLYNLAVAGIDCARCAICRYDYDVCVLVRKRSIDVIPELAFDSGDVGRLRPFLPNFCDEPFDGDVVLHNWPGLGGLL